MKILNINDIQTLTIKVTEEINPKNLHLFLKTSILNSGLPFSKNSFYYYFYHLDLLTYEIIFYEKNAEDIFLEPFLLLEEYSKTDNSVKVYVTDSYFVVVKSSKVLVLKKITTLDMNEISTYIQQIYNLSNFELIQISNETLLDIAQQKRSLYMDGFYPLYSKKSFNIFLAFSLLGLFLLLIFLYIGNLETANKVTPIVQKKIQVKHKSDVMTQVNLLFKNIKSNTIIIEKINYENKHFQTILYHKEQKKLLDFANIYGAKIDIKTLKYEPTKKLYRMEVDIEY